MESASPQANLIRPVAACLQVEVAKHMSRSLISVVQTFEGCNDNFLDSLSVLCHEVSMECLLPGQCCRGNAAGAMLHPNILKMSWHLP